MKYRALSLLAVVTFSGCAVIGDTTTSLTDESVRNDNSSSARLLVQKEVAKNTAEQCTSNAVRKLDDFVSPASVIGRRVINACYTEWMVFNKYVRPRGRRTAFMVGWYDQRTKEYRALATRAVLRSRSEQTALSHEAPAKGRPVERGARFAL